MRKKIFIFLYAFFLASILSAKSMTKDFATGDFIDLNTQYNSARNIITKIEKLSDNKAYVECSSLIFPASGDSVVGAHTVEVSYFYTVGDVYKQGRLIEIGENSLTFEYDGQYENPIYLFSSPEDEQVTFYFYDVEKYDWDKVIISANEITKTIVRKPSFQSTYSICFDKLENGVEYLFSYYLLDKNGEKSEIKYKYAVPNGQEKNIKTDFYCDISNLTCLARNRTLIFKWKNSNNTSYDKFFAEINGRTYEIGKTATELIVNNLCNSQIYDIKFYFTRGSEVSNPVFYQGTPKFTNTLTNINADAKNKKAVISWNEDKYEEFETVEISVEEISGYWGESKQIATYTVPKGTCFFEVTNLTNYKNYRLLFSLKDNMNINSKQTEKKIEPKFENTLSNLKTESKDYEILLKWDNSTSETYSSVEVTSSSGETVIVPFPQNSTTIKNLIPNKEYYFSIKMIDSEGIKTTEKKVYGFTSINNDIFNPKIQKDGNSIKITWDESKLTPYVSEIKVRDGLNTYKVKKGVKQVTIENPTGSTILISTVTVSGDESFALNLSY